MRTHYGMAGVECMTCANPHQFLLLPKHTAEGVRHHQCGGLAATAVTAKRLIADVEERERVQGCPWGNEDGERVAGDGIEEKKEDGFRVSGDGIRDESETGERSLLLGSEDSGVMGFRASEGMACKVCGCTEQDACVDPDTGEACSWAAPELCSVCEKGGTNVGE